jgi:hypothetical protein
MPGRTQPQHLIAGRQLGRRDPRARTTIDEERVRLRREVADHRDDRRGGVAEALRDLGRGRIFDEVRAQRLVLTLRDSARCREERGALAPPLLPTTQTGALR